MPYVLVRDTAVSWEDYCVLSAELAPETPAGLLLSAAGPTAEGVREVEVWRSLDELERFGRERRAPAASRTLRLTSEPTVRVLDVEQLVDARAAATSIPKEDK